MYPKDKAKMTRIPAHAPQTPQLREREGSADGAVAGSAVLIAASFAG